MKQKHTMDLTHGPVTKKLIAFVLPLIASNMLQHLYNAADKAVVGQFAGKVALAAVGSTGSATTMLLNLVFGLAVGANIINANLLGAKKNAELRRSMHSSILLALICGGFLCVLGLLAARPLLQLMSCPENVLGPASLYMRIFFCGVPASLMYNFGAGILRTHGDTRRPMIILAVSGLVNVCFNLVFVIVFKMTVDGVALATIISQYISAAWVLIILFDTKGIYRLKFDEIKFHKKEVVSIIKVGVPCGINGLVFSISNVTVQSTVNGFGDTVIAGNVAADSITGLIYQVIASFYTACVTFSGQCYGAGKYDRIDHLLLRGAGICVVVVVMVSLVATFFPGVLLGIFNSDADVIIAGTPKMLVMSWSYVLYSISESLLGCLRGMRKSAIPTSINIVGICVTRVLWICLVLPADPMNIFLLYACYPVSYVISVSAMAYYYLYCRRKLKIKSAALTA